MLAMFETGILVARAKIPPEHHLCVFRPSKASTKFSLLTMQRHKLFI